MTVTITEPGIHYDMPAKDYHGSTAADGPILSSTRAKTLLTEAGPAKFRHLQSHPETKKEYDEGNAAHAFALGKDADRLVIIDADNYRKPANGDLRDQAHAEGKTPLLPHQLTKAQDMAAELANHKQAMESLAGTTEVSMFHQLDNGLWIRGRMDVMADAWTTDYKTCADASSYAFTKQSYNLRYYMQSAWYRRMRAWLTGKKPLPYRIVAQESSAPYLVSVWDIDDQYLAQGEADMDEAINIYRVCVQSGKWPGYPNEIQTLTAPEWAMTDEIEID